jgi:hypothetical protein
MSDTADPKSPPPPPAKPKKKKRSWKRRGIITLIVLLVLAIVFRISLVLLLPTVMNKIAQSFKIKCTYDRLDLSLTGGSAAMWNFQLLPVEGGDPIFHADYLQGDISVANLLRGRLVVYRAAADGVDATFERQADGHIPLLDRFAALKTAPSTAAKTETTTSNPKTALDLQPPLRIDALRLEHVRARVHDLFVNPQVDARLALDLRLSNLGTPGEPTHFELDFSSDPMLDSLLVDGRASGDAKQLSATMHVLMRGLHPKPAQGYLSALGLRATADDISASMSGQLIASVNPNPNDGLKAELTLDHARVTADGHEAAALDELYVNIDSLSPGAAKVTKCLLQGVRATAGRDSNGALACAGIEVVPGAAAPAPPTATAAPPAQSPVAAAATSPFHWSLDKFSLGGLHLAFTDESMSPPVNLALNSQQIEMDTIDSANPDSPSVFSVVLTAPGLVREIRLAGQAKPLAGEKTFNLTATALGIAPTAIAPYLAEAGLASEWKDGAFTASAEGDLAIDSTGKLAADAHLSKIRLSDQREVFTMDDVRVQGAGIDPASRSVNAHAIDISGPAISVHRDADGNLHAFNFKTQPKPSGASAIAPPAETTAPIASAPTPAATEPSGPAAATASASLPFDNFELDHFAWKNVRLNLTDDAVTPPAILSTSDAGFSVEDLAIHLSQSSAAAKQGKIRAWLNAPEIASDCSFTGTISPGSQQAACDFDVHAAGLRAGPLAAYLRPLGLEPTLKSGLFTLHGQAKLDASTSTPKVSLALDHLQYSDGAQPLISVAGMAIKNFSTGSNSLGVESISINGPHARVLRRADGSLEAAGFHLISRPASKAPSAPAAPPTSTPPAAAVAQSAMETPPAPTPPAKPMAITVGSLDISDSAMDWTDLSVQPHVQTTLSANTTLGKFVFAPGAPAAPLHVTASLAGSMDQMTLDGSVAVSPDSQTAHLTFDAAGLRGGSLAAYLPPNLHVTLKGGTVHTTLDAAVARAAAGGGESIELSVNDFKYADPGQSPSLLQFDQFHLKSPRLDAPGHVIALNDITLAGLETSAHKTSGGIDLLGMELAPASSAAAQAASLAATPETAPPTPPATQPAVALSAAPAAPESNQQILRQIAAERNKLPLITLQTLKLNTRKFTFTDDTQPAAAPIVASDVNVVNQKPIVLLGRDPESNPLTEILLTGKIEPLTEKFNVNVKASPFTRQKTLLVDVQVSGIHGSGLTAVAPRLASKIDGRQLTDGQFAAALSASLKLQNVAATDFDVTHGGTLDLDVNNVAFRGSPSGPTLLGVGEIRSDGTLLLLNSGGLEFKTLEIDNLTARASRESDGIHAAGFVVKLPTTQPAAPANVAARMPELPKYADDAPAAVAANPPAAAAATAPAGPEVKVDKLLISGLDCQIQDHTCSPPVLIPINGLDVEAQDLTSNFKTADKPVRFNLLVSADKVPLPGPQPNQPASRELFSQIAGSGMVSLAPQLKGWTKLSLSGFELLGLRGLAHEEKLTLGGGTFDGDVDLRFPGDGTIDTSTRLVLTDLAITEPPNGVISHALKLPAPLDVVIGALQDPDGSITIPLNVKVASGQLDTASVVGAGVGALAEIITTAVASAPLKVAGLLTGPNKQNAEEPIELAFPAGYSQLGADQIAVLKPLAERLHKDDSLRVNLKCEPGRDDVQLAAERVNPTTTDALTLAQALSRRREQLLTARLDAASQVRALLASTDTDAAARAIERLRTIDRELADTEAAMDSAYDLLRPGANRQALRRTRSATLAIARARLDAVTDYLVNSGRHPLDSSRISHANPQFAESPEIQSGTVTITIVKSK